MILENASDVCDNDVKSVDLVNHLNENGYSLDKDTLFAKKNHVIMPSIKSAADKDIRAGLMFPVTIKIPGAEEISADGTGEVNTKTLSEAVVKIYPALKGKLKFIALDKALNQVSGTGFDCTESALYRFCCGEKERIINLEKNDLFIDAPFNYEGAFVKHILESNKIKF